MPVPPALRLSLMTALFCCPVLWAQQSRQDPLTPFKASTDTYLDLWRHGKYTESLKFLDNAINASSDGVPMRWLYDRADLYFLTGKIDEAISEIEWLHYRRPAAKSALQLAIYHQARGNRGEYERLLRATAERYIRFDGEKDDTENTIAILRIRELLGENPRALFEALDKIEFTEPEDRLMIHMARGDLACRKYDWALAAAEYQKVLDQDPKYLDAQAGLVECYWKSADPRLDKTKQALFKVNPVHLRALAVEVELALDANQLDRAGTLIDKALAINPHLPQYLGYKAAAAFLANDDAALQRAVQTALQFNPFAAEVYRVLGRVASRHYRFSEGAAFQEKALALDPDDNEARALLAFDLLRLGQEQRGRSLLEQCFQVDRFNVQVYNMLELLDTLRNFETLKRGPFIVRMPAKERKVWGDDVLALLEQAHRQLAADYQVKLPEPIHVQIFDSHDDFMVRSLGLPGAVGYLGICFGQLITMDTPSAREKGVLNWRATLWHEFTHVVTLSKTHNRMPRWLSEGISVYEETRQSAAWGQRPNPAYKAVVDQGLDELDDLERYFTEPKSQVDVVFGYFAAGEFARFYCETFGRPALLAALDAIGRGEDTMTALAAKAKLERKALDKRFASHMKKLLAPYKNVPGGSPGLFGASSDGTGLGGAPFTKALATAHKAITDKKFPEALRWLKEAEAVFPDTVGPESPRVLMAQVYALQGDKQNQRAMLEQIFAADGTDLDTCLALYPIYREARQWSPLRAVAERGLAIDPFNLEMWRALRDAQLGLGKSAEAKAALETLIQLDPLSNATYRLQRIDLLLGQGARAEARKEILALLEQAPYSWEIQKRLLAVSL